MIGMAFGSAHKGVSRLVFRLGVSVHMAGRLVRVYIMGCILHI